MFTVTTAATDTSLLTLAELRAAVGQTVVSDSVLTELGLRIAAVIARVCRIRASGAVPPTLRQETLTETLRLRQSREKLILARRHIGSVTSVTECGVALEATDYELDDSAGMLTRLHCDRTSCWPCGAKIVVVYTAGFAAVPDDLKLAAAKLASALFTESTRDPNLKRVKIDGVSEREYWVGPTSDPLVPREVEDLLAPYTNYSIG